MNQTPILEIHQDSVPLSLQSPSGSGSPLQQRILDSVIDYAPIAFFVVAGAVGAGLLLWYFRRRSDLGKPSLDDSKPKSSPIVSAESKSETIGSQTPVDGKESPAQTEITQHVIQALEEIRKGAAGGVISYSLESIQ